mgnify:CR=1 FL=1
MLSGAARFRPGSWRVSLARLPEDALEALWGCYHEALAPLQAAGRLGVEAVGNGYQTNALRLSLTNRTDKQLTAEIMRGTFFHNHDEFRQPLIVIASLAVTLAPRQTTRCATTPSA